MDILFTIDKNDYDKSWPHSKRPSIRGVIIKDGKLAMVYSTRNGYYKFPGGGMEPDEEHTATLIREVREEVGLTVIPNSVRPLGEVIRLQKSDMHINTVFEQENFYYLCDVEEGTHSQSLDDYELAAGFTLRYVTAEEAIQANLNSTDPDTSMLMREVKVLQYLLDNGYIR